jgi:hypothetical protein
VSAEASAAHAHGDRRRRQDAPRHTGGAGISGPIPGRDLIRRASLRDVLAAHKDRMSQPNVLWVAYPKANRADINRDTLWPILGEHGMRPIGQVSVDEVWSAMRFRPLKEGEAPFSLSMIWSLASTCANRAVSVAICRRNHPTFSDALALVRQEL